MCIPPVNSSYKQGWELFFSVYTVSSFSVHARSFFFFFSFLSLPKFLVVVSVLTPFLIPSFVSLWRLLLWGPGASPLRQDVGTHLPSRKGSDLFCGHLLLTATSLCCCFDHIWPQPSGFILKPALPTAVSTAPSFLYPKGCWSSQENSSVSHGFDFPGPLEKLEIP